MTTKTIKKKRINKPVSKTVSTKTEVPIEQDNRYGRRKAAWFQRNAGKLFKQEMARMEALLRRKEQFRKQRPKYHEESSPKTT